MKQMMVKGRSFATSYIAPYHFALLLFSIYAGIWMIPEVQWDMDEGDGRDFWPCVLIFYWIIVGFFGSIFAGMQTGDGYETYKKKLKRTKYSVPKREIVAELNDRTGEILVYEESKSILEKEKKLLNTFNQDDDDEIHTYVAGERERIAEPDLRKAKAIVNTINGN